MRPHERQFYATEAIVEAYVIEHTGHVAHLEGTAPLANECMIAFSEQYVGQVVGRWASSSVPGRLP